ncbi:MAG: phytanoyl-CoA dioxygenase family protein [Candidatus Latescibacterota bacterium]
MSLSAPAALELFEVSAADLDMARTASLYREHGCLVVRGLLAPYVPAIAADIEAAAQAAISLLDQGQQIAEGWRTPDGTLFLPAPPGFGRPWQIMVLACSYETSSTFFHSALDPRLLDLVEAILGPDVEVFGRGQCLYKEPGGGHAKHLHQDGVYFEHRFEGPVGALTYVVPTDLENGALHVAPGSHRAGILEHVDTFSHLGLDAGEWPWERTVPVCGEPGDTILFHVRTVHGSRENHSRAPRPVFIHRYRQADDYVTVSATTTANRREAERRAGEARKENQRGLMVRGRRTYHPGPEGGR